MSNVVFGKSNGWTEYVDAARILQSDSFARSVASSHGVTITELRTRARQAVNTRSGGRPVESSRSRSAATTAVPSADSAQLRLQRVFGWSK